METLAHKGRPTSDEIESMLYNCPISKTAYIAELSLRTNGIRHILRQKSTGERHEEIAKMLIHEIEYVLRKGSPIAELIDDVPLTEDVSQECSKIPKHESMRAQLEKFE